MQISTKSLFSTRFFLPYLLLYSTIVVRQESKSTWLRGQYNLNILGFRDYENAPLDVQFGPNDLLKPDTYIMAVINNQYLDNLARLND